MAILLLIVLGQKSNSYLPKCPKALNQQLVLRSFPNLHTTSYTAATPIQTSSSKLQVSSINTLTDDDDSGNQFRKTSEFLIRAGITGALTGLGVVLFKSSLAATSSVFYESLADILPKPSFYWPLALYPVLGSLVVCLITYLCGSSIKNGVDSIAQTIDADVYEEPRTRNDVPVQLPWTNEIDSTNNTVLDIYTTSINDKNGTAIASFASKDTFNPSRNIRGFDPIPHLFRLMAATATVGSGCSLGPEGPAVEIGTSLSRMISGTHCTLRERHRLFLCGTAAAVAAGFNAPIAGVFFAIECGNRYLAKNTIKLDEGAPDGPRADIAAIVLAASAANVVVGLGLHESQALAIQGNAYAMSSPLFELSLYLGLGLASGLIAVIFGQLKKLFTKVFNEEGFTPLSRIPEAWRPVLGGLLCGIVAVYFPQTLFVGYATLDQLLAGKIVLATPLLLQLLGLKLFLTTFSLGSGLVGGVFAPALFFGATGDNFSTYPYPFNDYLCMISNARAFCCCCSGHCVS